LVMKPRNAYKRLRVSNGINRVSFLLSSSVGGPFIARRRRGEPVRGKTAHAAPNVFHRFQKRVLVTRRTLRFL